MANKKLKTTKHLLKAHSIAKVELYTQYLSAYLSILGNNKHIKRVHLYDVLCGEGKYADNAEGSALKSLRTVLAYQTKSPASLLKILVTLNDGGKSDIEPELKKIDRVKKYAENIPLNSAKTSVTYSKLDYTDILQNISSTINKLQADERALIFIDPWGYKSLKPQKLHELLKSGRSEILLFLPVAHMYRFANSAMASEFDENALKCMEPLKFLLKELFDNEVPVFKEFDVFLQNLRDKLENVLSAKFTGKFVLESSDYNKYALFFFTSHIKGLEVFVDSCWKIDSTDGKGFFNKKNKSTTLSLFTPEILHIQEVLDFIKVNKQITNHQLYIFGLTCTMTKSMTNKALNFLREKGRIIAVEEDEKTEARKGANYLGYNQEKTIHFKHIS